MPHSVPRLPPQRVEDEMKKAQVRVERKNEDEHASIHGAKSASNAKRGA